jgi:hypothetical protein
VQHRGNVLDEVSVGSRLADVDDVHAVHACLPPPLDGVGDLLGVPTTRCDHAQRVSSRNVFDLSAARLAAMPWALSGEIAGRPVQVDRGEVGADRAAHVLEHRLIAEPLVDLGAPSGLAGRPVSQ